MTLCQVFQDDCHETLINFQYYFQVLRGGIIAEALYLMLIGFYAITFKCNEFSVLYLIIMSFVYYTVNIIKCNF